MSYSDLYSIFEEVVASQGNKKDEILHLSKLFSHYKKSIDHFTSSLSKAQSAYKPDRSQHPSSSTLEKSILALLSHIQTLSDSLSSLSRSMQIDIIEPLDLFNENYSSMLNELKKEGLKVSRDYKISYDRTLRERAEYYHFSSEAEKAARLGITENSKEKQETAERIEQKWISKSEDKLNQYIENMLKTNEILEDYEKIIPPVMMNIQQVEESRVQFLKNSLDKFLRYFRRFESGYQASFENLEKSVAEISPGEDIKVFVNCHVADKVLKKEEFMSYSDWKKSLNEDEYEIMDKEQNMAEVINAVLIQNALKMDSSVLNEVYGLVGYSEGRRIFVEQLEGFENSFIKRDNLNLLAQVIRNMIDQIVNKKEYDAYLFCKILELSTKFSSADDQKVFLCEQLAGHIYWNETVRWIQAINYAINSKIVIVEDWGKKDLELGIKEMKNIEKIENTSAYATISQFIYQLSRLNVAKPTASSIITQICSEFQISSEKSNLLIVELYSRSQNSYKPTRSSHPSLLPSEYILRKSLRFLQTIDLIQIGSINKNLNKYILRLLSLRTYKVRKNFFHSNKTMRRKLWLDSLNVASLSALDYSQSLHDFSLHEEKYSEICRIIDMDVARSYQKVPEVNSEQLKNILKTFAHYKPSIGYCQGMNYIAGTLLYVIKDQELTFRALVSLIENFKMGSLFNYKLKKLKKLFFVFDRLISVCLPRLNKTFSDTWIFSDNYSSGWFIALFGGIFMTRFDVLLQIWDLFLLYGWKGLFKVCIGIMSRYESQLINQSLEHILSVLSSISTTDIFNSSFFNDLNNLSISNSLIQTIKQEYKSIMKST